jgi:hypothetical protein
LIDIGGSNLSTTAIIINGDAELALGTRLVRDKKIQMILTDPLYNYSKQIKAMYQQVFEQICLGTIIVFCPSKNPWTPEPPDQKLVWAKPVSTKNTSKSYSNFIEEVYLFEQKRHKHYGDRMHWSNYTNILTDKVDLKVHQWRKPPSMIERFIQIHTDVGDWVLDPFSGSGVVADCATKLGRNSISIERNLGLCNDMFDLLKISYPWANLSLKVVE